MKQLDEFSAKVTSKLKNPQQHFSPIYQKSFLKTNITFSLRGLLALSKRCTSTWPQKRVVYGNGKAYACLEIRRQHKWPPVKGTDFLCCVFLSSRWALYPQGPPVWQHCFQEFDLQKVLSFCCCWNMISRCVFCLIYMRMYIWEQCYIKTGSQASLWLKGCRRGGQSRKQQGKFGTF